MSNTKRYDLLQSCVALRTMLGQLDSGSKVTIIPGGLRHRQIDQSVKQMELYLLNLKNVATVATGAKRQDVVKPRSLYVRKTRDKQRKAINDLIDKYFRVHGKPKAIKRDRKSLKLLTESKYVSVSE
jgi:hypothetical protein